MVSRDQPSSFKAGASADFVSFKSWSHLRRIKHRTAAFNYPTKEQFTWLAALYMDGIGDRTIIGSSKLSLLLLLSRPLLPHP